MTKDALNRLAEQGVFLIPATGRTYGGCRGVLEGLQGIPYVITCNGAVYMTGRQSSVCTETVWNWKIICLCWLNWISFL